MRFIFYSLMMLLITGLLHCSDHEASKIQRRKWMVKTSALQPFIGSAQKPSKITSLKRHPPTVTKLSAAPFEEDAADISGLFFKHYTTEQGLPTNSILCSTVDPEGNIWFGTVGAGIVRYDGKNFKGYSIANGLPSGVALSIIADSKGNIWIGTTAGVCKYDGYRFITFPAINSLVGSFVTSLIEDRNHNIWIGTQEGGVCRYDGKNFTRFSTENGLPSNYIQCLLADINGSMWIGTEGGGLCHLQNNNIRVFDQNSGLPNDHIHSLLQDQKGNIWIGTRNGICRFDGSLFTSFNTKSRLGGNVITSMEQDLLGNIWIGTRYNGVSRFNGIDFTNFGRLPGWSGNSITDISKDLKGNMWFTSFGEGISRFMDNNLIHLNLPQRITDNSIFSSTIDNRGNLWLGTQGGGASRYDGKKFTYFSNGNGLPNDWIWDIFQDSKGHIWFATDNHGVYKYDGLNFMNYTTLQGLASNGVVSLYQDKKGKMWFGTISGVSCMDDSEMVTYNTSQGFAGIHIQRITDDDSGHLWFASHDEGVIKFDGRHFLNFTTAHGLASNTVYSMAKDNFGNLWFGTNRGVTKFDGKDFVNYTTADGLPDNIVWDMDEDSARGIIWLGTNEGLAVIHQKNDQIKFETFNARNGYPIKDVGAGTLCVDKEGLVWMTTEHSNLIKFDYSLSGKKKSQNLNLKIQSVKVNNENICWNAFAKNGPDNSFDSLSLINEMALVFPESSNLLSLADSIKQKYEGIRFDSLMRYYPVPSNPVLPYEDNTLDIEFGAIDPSAGSQVKYSYFLENYSRNWSTPSENTIAEFGNIPPGKYTFEVRGIINGKVEGLSVYPFQILAPWWMTWWAYILYAILAFGLLFGIYRLRIRTIKRTQAMQMHIMVSTQEEERSRIARELHDEVGVKLSTLKLFLSSLTDTDESVRQNSGLNSLFIQSRDLIGEAMQDVRRLLLNLSPSVLEEFGYLIAVKTLIDKLNYTGKMNISFSSFGFESRLHKDYELSIYRMTQELIHNTIKHSRAKNVTLTAGLRDEMIILMVEDDGKGFRVSDVGLGYGLHNLRIRTQLMKGIMLIDSQPGKGTHITIEIPYQKRK